MTYRTRSCKYGLRLYNVNFYAKDRFKPERLLKKSRKISRTMFTEKEQQLIQEKRAKLIRKIRARMRKLHLIDILIKDEFFSEYIRGIPLEILKKRSYEDNREYEIALLKFEHKEEIVESEQAELQYDFMYDQESEIASLQYETMEEYELEMLAQTTDIAPHPGENIKSQKHHDVKNKSGHAALQKRATPEASDADSGPTTDGILDPETLAIGFVLQKNRTNESYTREELANAAGVPLRTLYRRLRGNPAEWSGLKDFMESIEDRNTSGMHHGEKKTDQDGNQHFEAW